MHAAPYAGAPMISKQRNTGRAAAARGLGALNKVCHRCGKDLTQQLRYYDGSGYWCAPCSKEDKKQYRANHLPCDDCGSDIRRGSEIVAGELRLCPVCHQKREVARVRQAMREEAVAQRTLRRHRRLRTVRNWCLVAMEIVLAGWVLRWVDAREPVAGARPPATASSSAATPQALP